MKIYVAGPYTAKTKSETEQNVNNAIDAGIEIFKKGHFPYIPHLTHWIELRCRDTNQDLKWEDYLEMDRVWLDLCDAILFLKESRGANLELEHAKKRKKTIFYSIVNIPHEKRTYNFQFE